MEKPEDACTQVENRDSMWFDRLRVCQTRDDWYESLDMHGEILTCLTRIKCVEASVV